MKVGREIISAISYPIIFFFEIKPKSLHSNLQNIAKWESAKIWCNKRGYQFKVFSEYDYDKLNQDDIDNLIKDGKLILI